MDAGAADSARRAILAGVVFCDLPLGAEGTAAGANRIAGSAQWPCEAESVGHTVVNELLRIAQSQGYAIPDTLLFRAGQVFYHEGRVSEVRLAGLVPGRPDTAGQLTFTPWSTPIAPTVTEGPQGELVLHATDHCRSHFSALVVPARTVNSQMLIACLWDLREPTLGEGRAEASSTPSQLPLLRDEHFTVLSPAHYQAVREVITHNTFTQVDGVPWPVAPIRTGPAQGQAQLRPIVVEMQPFMSPQDTEQWAQRMWQQRAELSDLDADALDALSALWLYQAHTPQGDAVADVDELLAMRGLQPKRGGLGRRGGYEPEQRSAMLQAVSRIQNLWLHLTALEVYQYTGISLRRRRRKATTELDVQSRVFTITDLLGRTRPDGFMDVERFIFRPGKVFAHFLFGPGRQTALLSAKALHYDPYRQTWEKRLVRYLSYQWRCKAHAGDALQPFRVVTLLDAVGVHVNERKPSETRTRLEKALDALLQDSVIAAWQYDRWDEGLVSQRGWAQHWLQATILIEPPDIIRETYQRLARYETFAKRGLPSPKTLGDQLKARRQELRLSQLQAAEQIGISPSYLNRLEQGNRGRKITAALQHKLDAWLARPVMPQE